MTCVDCNTSQHYNCLSPTYQASLYPIYEYFKKEEPNVKIGEIKARSLIGEQILRKTIIQTEKYRCESCIRCKNCQKSNLEVQRGNKWSKDFSLCKKCNEKKQKKRFCPICELIWNKKTDGRNPNIS